MSNVLLWLIAVEIIGLAALPLVYMLLPRLSDRGYGFSKAFGLLLVGYAAWILSALHLVPSIRITLVGLVALMAAGSAAVAYNRRGEMLAFLRERWRLIAVIEIVFIAFFLAWTLLRAYNPAIDHTEQPMDMAFLNASIEATMGQPEDPWFRGESISYYYFGYWMMGVLSELSGVASNYSYNLAMALVPALAAAGMVSLVVSVIRPRFDENRDDRRKLVMAVAGGIGAAMVLGAVGNLHGVLEFMRANAIGSQGFYDWVGIRGLDGPANPPTDSVFPSEFWWWFRSSRVIGGEGDYTIQEYPFFSYMLGDLHPHMMAIPLALLVAAFALDYFRRSGASESGLRKLGAWEYGTLAAMAVSLGGLAFTNFWDMPTCAALLIGAAALRAYRQPMDAPGADGSEVPAYDGAGAALGRMARAAVVPLLVVAIAVLLYLPYYLDLPSSVEGVGAVAVASRHLHTFIVWGVPLIFVAPFVVACFWQTTVDDDDWRLMTAISIAVAFLPFIAWMIVRLDSPTPTGNPIGRFVHILPLALLIAMAAWSAIHEAKTRGATGKAFALALATLALLLILGPELLHVNDSFGGQDERMNTVFKLYYQAWVMLAAVSGYSIYYWLTTRAGLVRPIRTLSTFWAVGALTLAACGLYLTAGMAATETGNFGREPTLNGLQYVERVRPDEYAAIAYVRDNVPEGSAMLESVGEWFDAGLISRSTGVPTIINWPGHELQWRGASDELGERQRDAATIYATTDADEARILLDKYDVEYVYVGPRERAAHDGAGLEKFGEFMDVAFERGDVRIYKMR